MIYENFLRRLVMKADVFVKDSTAKSYSVNKHSALLVLHSKPTVPASITSTINMYDVSVALFNTTVTWNKKYPPDKIIKALRNYTKSMQ